jgi:N-acetylmuramoyl-L-alanine amidase
VPSQTSLSWVIMAALIVATLFTIWTEPNLLPASFSQAIETAMQAASGEGETYPTPTPRQGTLVGIVAGHSAFDSGAVCPPELGSVREVDINMAVAERVRVNLIAEGYNAVLLTEFDDRLNLFNANALISIHADSCDYINEEATGFKVAAALSSRYPEMASRLTNCVRARYAEVTGMSFHAGSITADMSAYHAFSEIDALTPAAIIEVGFMNLDYELLTKRPDLLAEGITKGLLCFLRNEDINQTP